LKSGGTDPRAYPIKSDRNRHRKHDDD
jgi:hypothetical protein